LTYLPKIEAKANLIGPPKLLAGNSTDTLTATIIFLTTSIITLTASKSTLTASQSVSRPLQAIIIITAFKSTHTPLQ